MASPTHYKAVIFDLGGVVYDSPLVGLGRYATELGLASGFFKKVQDSL